MSHSVGIVPGLNDAEDYTKYVKRWRGTWEDE